MRIGLHVFCVCMCIGLLLLFCVCVCVCVCNVRIEMEELNKIKDVIAQKSKRNYMQEKEISELDKKIFVLIKSKMSIEETLAMTGGSVSSLRGVTMQTEDPSTRELYGQLFYLLQHDTVYVSLLTSQILLGEVDTLLQIVMFTLYGNQYEEDEEHLLLTVFRDVLASEVARAYQPTAMFRSNTSLTRMLTTYTRRSPGLQFVKIALGEWLAAILGDPSLDLEIFPDKIRDKLVSEQQIQMQQQQQMNQQQQQQQPMQIQMQENQQPQQIQTLIPQIEESPEQQLSMQANQQPQQPQQQQQQQEGGGQGGPAFPDAVIQEIIQPRIPCIEELVRKLLESLEQHLEDVPYGIRWICKQTKRLVGERWPDLPEEQQLSLVGGFFVLRYLNPAIITPGAYGIVPQDAPLPPNGRRNLTIIAKVVQNLSNGINFSTVKESYMAVLNFILDKYRSRMAGFINALTEVDDLDHHLGLDIYAALTKFSSRSNTIRITLNEMHFVHDLILRHKDTVFASLSPTDKIFEVLNAMPPPPPQLPAAENQEIVLQLLPPLAKDEDDEVQLSKIAPERLLSDAKYAMFLLIHKLPVDVLREILEAEKSSGDGDDGDDGGGGGSGSGGTIQAFLKRARAWGVEHRPSKSGSCKSKSKKKGKDKKKGKEKSEETKDKKKSYKKECSKGDDNASDSNKAKTKTKKKKKKSEKEGREEESPQQQQQQEEEEDKDKEKGSGSSGSSGHENAERVCVLAEKVLTSLKQLAMIGVLREEDDYAEFREELSEVVAGLDAQIERLDRDTERLCSVSKSLDDKYAAAQQVAASYWTYLNNVRQRASTFSSKRRRSTPAAVSASTQKQSATAQDGGTATAVAASSSATSTSSSGAGAGNTNSAPDKEIEPEKLPAMTVTTTAVASAAATVSSSSPSSQSTPPSSSSSSPQSSSSSSSSSIQRQQQRKSVVVRSTKLNQKTQSKTAYEFSSESPGIYKVQVLVDKKAVGSFDLFLDDLLEKQFDGCQVISNEYGEFDVAQLIFFFNKKFNNVKE